jgi:hypothetical protein
MDDPRPDLFTHGVAPLGFGSHVYSFDHTHPSEPISCRVRNHHPENRVLKVYKYTFPGRAFYRFCMRKESFLALTEAERLFDEIDSW